MSQRLLVIGLDGFELSLAEEMLAAGELPHFARVREASRRFTLDHGIEKYSGLTWEHVSTGRTPSNGGRWSAVDFDRDSYGVSQTPTALKPFLADAAMRAVVFDVPYFDLSLAPKVRGVTSWGAHDPGVEEAYRPREIHAEMEERFGHYPADEFVYGFLWPSPERTQRGADMLERAVEVRAAASRWLLAERLPDWDLGIVVVSEPHSAIEPMWHGVDKTHPLHGVPSAPIAAEGVKRIYRAVDRLIGTLAAAFPDARLVVFAMHGMGPNEADLAAMALLPELLHRHSFGKPYMKSPEWQSFTDAGVPLLPSDASWTRVMAKLVHEPPFGSFLQSGGKLAGGISGLPARLLANRTHRAPVAIRRSNLDWMPAARYRHLWPRMQAFALPAFYDGRIRINLAGREAHGVVPRWRYKAVRGNLVRLLRECRDPRTGVPVVDNVYWIGTQPGDMGPADADLYVTWRGAPFSLSHPKHGTVGPLPFRRTGGHTGASGFLMVSGEGIKAADSGEASAFDVVPTLIEMAGGTKKFEVTGTSLSPRIFAN